MTMLDSRLQKAHAVSGVIGRARLALSRGAGRDIRHESAAKAARNLAQPTSKKRIATWLGRRRPVPRKTLSEIQASDGAAHSKRGRQRVDRFATNQPAHDLDRRGSHGVVVHVDELAGFGLEDIARLESGHRRADDELEVGAARNDARTPVTRDAATAQDRDDAAKAGRDSTDLERRADLDGEIGEDDEAGGGQRIGSSRRRDHGSSGSDRCDEPSLDSTPGATRIRR
jgi:hypothetical protein